MKTCSHLEEIKVNYNTEEWISAFPGGITSVEVDGDKLISIKRISKTAEKLKLLAVLFVGVVIGALGEYLLVKENLVPAQELEELWRTKYKLSPMSNLARLELRQSGVVWNQDRKEWVWSGNGLAISSHDKQEIKD